MALPGLGWPRAVVEADGPRVRCKVHGVVVDAARRGGQSGSFIAATRATRTRDPHSQPDLRPALAGGRMKTLRHSCPG
jgi:hypothetical protein